MIKEIHKDFLIKELHIEDYEVIKTKRHSIIIKARIKTNVVFIKCYNNKFSNEKSICEYLYSLDFPCAKLLTTLENYPYTYLIYEFIFGCTLTFLLNDNNFIKSIYKFGKYLYMLHHEIDIEQRLLIYNVNTQDYFLNTIRKCKKITNKFNWVTYDKTILFLENNCKYTDNCISILHGDYHFDNIILSSPENRFIVVDWENSFLGDYRIDLARTLITKPINIQTIILSVYEKALKKTINYLEIFMLLESLYKLLQAQEYQLANNTEYNEIELTVMNNYNEIFKNLIYN